ncbi:MAG: HAD hydrolase-like protein [Nocardiopsaceae bacterium]|nr:HAD hydrolase-like protein [Nocardiopsaceae bacterium]
MGDLLVLWDVDGTLLNAGGVGGDLYETVFAQLFGCSLEAFAPMAGRTDRAIILETLELAGIRQPRRYVDPFIWGLSAHAPSVREAVAARGHALPGAAEVLAALAAARIPDARVPMAPAVSAGAGITGARVPASWLPDSQPVTVGADAPPRPGGTDAWPRPTRVDARAAPTRIDAQPVTAAADARPVTAGVGDAGGAGDGCSAPTLLDDHGGYDGPDRGRGPGRIRQSVLTGNVRQLAEVKLAALDLLHGLDLCIGAYGDDHEVRAELVHVARRRARAVHGRLPGDFADQATVVLGDTPLDVEAALAAGARAVGIATGRYPAADLAAAGAHAVLPDLTDPQLVMDALLP